MYKIKNKMDDSVVFFVLFFHFIMTKQYIVL